MFGNPIDSGQVIRVRDEQQVVACTGPLHPSQEPHCPKRAPIVLLVYLGLHQGGLIYENRKSSSFARHKAVPCRQGRN